jgi:AbiTii
MRSLVEELHEDTSDSLVKTSNLLRRGRTIAHKLNLPNVAAWAENELNGYSDDQIVPSYRFIHGRIEGLNPFHGWQPLIFEDSYTENMFSRQSIGQKVALLEDIALRNRSSEFVIRLNRPAKQWLMKAPGIHLDFAVILGARNAVGILDAVRNVLLDWCLELEEVGIKGEGMSFSNEELDRAHEVQAIYEHPHHHGAQIRELFDPREHHRRRFAPSILELANRIRLTKAQLGLNPKSVQKLSRTLDGLQHEMESEKPSANRVREFLVSLRKVMEESLGSQAAQCTLHELSKLMK